MKYNSFEKKITYNRVALIMAILFLVSILPILYCSFFDYATGDDLWEGAVAYRVLVNKGSIKEFFSEVFEWAKIDYMGWEGNWSSIILWCLEPSIWGEKVYCITPWIALLSLGGGTTYFLFYFLKKYFSGCFSFLIIVSSVVCFFSIQFMPYVRSGIFWYTGMVNYVVPYGLCLISFVWMDKFIETEKKRYLIYTALFFTYLGGTGYTTIVLAFEILLFVILYYLFCNVRTRRFQILWMLLPFLLLIIGFAFSAISPGNAARGGDNYQLSIQRIILTIFDSIKQGLYGGINWFISIRPLFLTMPLLFIVTWELIDITKVKLKLRHPIIVVLFLFLISCSVYSPGIYALSEVSGGVPDSIFFVFMLTYTIGIIYLTCYLKKLYIEKKWRFAQSGLAKKLRFVILSGTVLTCVFLGKHMIGNMASYICIDFIRSGQLYDFEYQMQERLKILHDPEIENVVLPEMNSEQGPFMHMALLADPDSYTNQATARFYGKKSVIAIPRTEFYELYGYPDEKKEMDGDN